MDEKERYYQEALRGEHGMFCKRFALDITEGVFGLRPDANEAKTFLMNAIKHNLHPVMTYVDNEGVYDNLDEVEDCYIEFRTLDYDPINPAEFTPSM